MSDDLIDLFDKTLARRMEPFAKKLADGAVIALLVQPAQRRVIQSEQKEQAPCPLRTPITPV